MATQQADDQKRGGFSNAPKQGDEIFADWLIDVGIWYKGLSERAAPTTIVSLLFPSLTRTSTGFTGT